MFPLVSIITVNYNNKVGLAKTLNSVKCQTFTNYEHIIIDANSTDGSKEVIKEYEKESTNLTYWISEKDAGIYDGMNKGIEHANGEYIYFLNSGDYLSNSEVLSSISFDGTQFICGNMNIEYADAACEKITSPNTVDAIFLLKTFLPHPASFMHNSLFKDNKYRTDYLIISDWIHMIESIIFNECSYKHVNVLVSIFDSTGISSQNGDIGQRERNKWIKEQISIPVYNALMELDSIKSSKFSTIFPVLNQKSIKTQKRITKLILFLSRFL